MKFVRFIWRVVRRLVWETAMDNTTGLAAQLAYLLLVALAPGLLFLWHLLGLFGTDPAKLHKIFVILKDFLPPDPRVQDILDAAVASVVVTGSSGLLANAESFSVFISGQCLSPRSHAHSATLMASEKTETGGPNTSSRSSCCSGLESPYSSVST